MKTKIKRAIFVNCLFILPIIFVEAKSAEPPVSSDMVVGLYSFNYLRNVREVYPITVAGHISEKLSCFENINVLNESTFPVLGKAIEDSKEAESALAETIEQGRRKNAKKLVTGFVSAVEEEYEYTTRSFRVSIILDIGIVDVETGQMEASKQFIFQGLNTLGIFVKIALKKAGIPSHLATVDDILAIMGEKGIIKAIEKSLGDLDKELFPFLEKSFGKYNKQCIVQRKSGERTFKMPTFGKKKDKTEIFDIVNKNSNNTLLISTNGNKKWSKRTSFDILTEIEEEDLQGNTILREILIETVKFEAYSGNYAIIQFPKKSEANVDEIVQSIKNGDNVYVMYHQKNRAVN